MEPSLTWNNESNDIFLAFESDCCSWLCFLFLKVLSHCVFFGALADFLIMGVCHWGWHVMLALSAPAKEQIDPRPKLSWHSRCKKMRFQTCLCPDDLTKFSKHSWTGDSCWWAANKQVASGHLCSRKSKTMGWHHPSCFALPRNDTVRVSESGVQPVLLVSLASIVEKVATELHMMKLWAQSTFILMPLSFFSDWEPMPL